MPDPGLGFARLSHSTLGPLFACPRYAYLRQILGIRRRPLGGLEKPAASSGSVFHTLLEVHYRTEPGPLRGTDGAPELSTPDEVADYYLRERDIGAPLVYEAIEAYNRYVHFLKGSLDPLSRDVGLQPEVDLVADLRDALEPKPGRREIPYQMRADLICRPRKSARGVVIVDHKLVQRLDLAAFERYRYSGQFLGAAACWYARPDLQEKYGPLRGFCLNLTFKKPRVGAPPLHREWYAIPDKVVEDFIGVVEEANREVRRRKREVDWPKTGLLTGRCAGAWRKCQYADICWEGDNVSSMQFDVPDGARNIAADHGLVQIQEPAPLMIGDAP